MTQREWRLVAWTVAVCAWMFLVVGGLSGCAEREAFLKRNKSGTARTPPHAKNNRRASRSVRKSGGVYHTVQRGQTLYRIAYTYNVKQKSIIRANRIKDPTHLSVGQKLFIPGAKSVRSVPPTALTGVGGPARTFGGPPPPRRAPAAGDKGCRMKYWPVDGTVTSRYGVRGGRQHDGIDIAAGSGETIVAPSDGVVTYEGTLAGYGRIIILKHEGPYKTVYAHNSRNYVKKGQVVQRGQRIATVGTSGNASGPHVHFEIRKNGEAIDPQPCLP